jgi:two-component sensor histidine kinase
MMPEPRADTVTMTLDPGPFAPRVARTAVQRALAEGAPAIEPDVVEQAMLLTSELVTNAVIHAQTAVALTISVADSSVHVLVEDGDCRLPAPADTSGPQGGFGLHIVERLANTWGAAASSDGKAVWFELGWRPRDERAVRDEFHRALG